jgi:hypothetical protein
MVSVLEASLVSLMGSSWELLWVTTMGDKMDSNN